MNKEFIYNEAVHLDIAKNFYGRGREIKDLCKRLNIDQVTLQAVEKANPDFGFVVNKIRDYSYIPPSSKSMYVEVPWQSKFNPEVHPNEVIKLFGEGLTISQICSQLKVTRATYNNWRANYEIFNKAHECGLTRFQGYWEGIMAEGIRGNIKNFNSNTLNFFIRNQFKEDYADTKHIATIGTYTALSSEELSSRTAAKLEELIHMQGRAVIEGVATEIEDGEIIEE